MYVFVKYKADLIISKVYRVRFYLIVPMGLQQLGSLLFRRQARFYVTRLSLCFITKFRVTLMTVSLYSNMEIRTSWSLMLP